MISTAAPAALCAAACLGPPPEGNVEGDAPATSRRPALSETMLIALDASIVREGDGATLRALLVCADSAEPVGGRVTWSDPDDPSPDGDAQLVDLQPAAAPPGSACAQQGQPFMVCDPAQGMECRFDKRTPYADNAPGDAARTVTATFTQDGSSESQGAQLTVANAAPLIEDVSSSGLLAEGALRSYDTLVFDPGLRADEIARVEYAFTPVAGVRNDGGLLRETITCDCSATPDCDNGLDSGHCGVAGGGGTVSTVEAQLLDDDLNPFLLTVTVFDRDGAAGSDATTFTSVGNVPPENVRITGLSLSAELPTAVAEGALRAIPLTFHEAGIDQLAVAYDLDTRMPAAPEFAAPDVAGVAAVTKASYPGLASAALDPTPAPPPNVDASGGLLELAIRFDDDNDGAPNALDLRVSARVSDDDDGVNQQQHFVRVLDVDPIIDSFTGGDTVAEGGVLTWTVGARSGAEAPGYDDLHATAPYHWRIGTFPFPELDELIDGAAAGAQYVIEGGCGPLDASCALRFVDDDPMPLFYVTVGVQDEDSETGAEGTFVFVENVLPQLTSWTVNGASLPGTIIDEGTVATSLLAFADPAGALDGPYTVTLDYDSSPPSQDVAALPAPGTFEPLDELFNDEDRCRPAPGSQLGSCFLSATVCEAPPSGGGDGPTSFIGACSTTVYVLTVRNVAPSVAAFAPDGGATLVEGMPFTLAGDFDDPADFDDEPYALQWTWDDGGPRSESVAGVGYDARLSAPDITTSLVIEGVPAAGVDTDFTLSVTDGDDANGAASARAHVRDNVPTLLINGVTLAPTDEEMATPTIHVLFRAESDADRIDRIEVDWGDGSPLTVFTEDIRGRGAVEQLLALTKPAPYADSDGDPTTPATDPFIIRATIFDEDSSAQATAPAPVRNVPPSFVRFDPDPRPGALIVPEGHAAAFLVTADDPAAPDLPALQLHVAWGDGTPEETFAVDALLQGGAGGVLFRAAHVYQAPPATFPARFYLTDREGGRSGDETILVDVVNIAPVITDVFSTGPAPEAAPLTSVVEVDNRGADVLDFTFNDECDAAVVDDTDFIGLPRLASAVHEHVYADDGGRTLCVRVCDDDALPDSCAYAALAVSIVNAPPTIAGFLGGAVGEGGALTLTASASDPAGANDPLTMTFECGDGGEPAPLGPDAAACTYARSGAFVARVSVDDGDRGVVSASASVQVANLPPALGAIAVDAVDQGEPSVFRTSGAFDPGAGDELTLQLDVDADGAFELSAPIVEGAGAAAHRYRGRGAFTARLRACDHEGACSPAQTIAAVVDNLAPSISEVNVPATAVAGAPVVVSVAAADAGDDPLTYTFRFRRAADGDLVASSGPQASAVAAQAFPEPGAYLVEVVAHDGQADSEPRSASFSITELSVPLIAHAQPNPIDEGGTTRIRAEPSGVGPYVASFDVNGDGDFFDDVDVRDLFCSGEAGGEAETDDCEVTVSYPQNRPGEIAYRVLVQIVDRGDNDAIAHAVVAIDVHNLAPTLAPIAGATVEEGAFLGLELEAGDVPADEDGLRFSLEGAVPAGMIVDALAGGIAWTPTFRDVGLHTIRARVTDGDGAFAEQSFTVEVLRDPDASHAPGAPTIIAPDNGIDVDTLTPRLTIANAVSPRGTPTYVFCVRPSPTGEDEGGGPGAGGFGIPPGEGEGEGEGEPGELCIGGVAEGESTTSVIVDIEPGLVEGGRYEWYAYADDGTELGAHSALGRFVVDAQNVAPPAPQPLSPALGAHFLVGTLPTLEARAVDDDDGDAVTYRFEVALSPAFDPESGDIVAQSSVRVMPFFTLPAAPSARTYYWRAFAADGALESEPGASASFVIDELVVNTAPTSPGLVGPHGEINETHVELQLKPSADAERDVLLYEFEIADNAAFAGAKTSGRIASISYPTSRLLEDTVYFWRARAFDGDLYSDWTSASFIVNAVNGAPLGLTLLTPSDGAVLDAAPPAIIVQNALDPEGDALQYVFIVALDEQLHETVLKRGVAEGDGLTTTFSLTEAELAKFEPGVEYFVHVSASDGLVAGEAHGTFKLAAPGPAGGCGCDADGNGSGSGPLVVGAALLGLGTVLRRRRRR